MKKGLHPSDYRTVVMEDISNGFRFVTKSTAKTEETTKWEDGKEYPWVKIHISSESHPFYTGQEKLLDVEGRVDKFKARAEAAKAKQEALKNKAAKAKAKKDAKPEAEEAKKLGAKPLPKAKKNKSEKKPEDKSDN